MTPSIASDQIVPSKASILPAPLPNPSLQVTADHQLKQVDAPVYAPRRGEVLLQIKATGICGYALFFFFLTMKDMSCVLTVIDRIFISGKPEESIHSFSKVTASLAMRQPVSSCSVVRV